MVNTPFLPQGIPQGIPSVPQANKDRKRAISLKKGQFPFAKHGKILAFVGVTQLLFSGCFSAQKVAMKDLFAQKPVATITTSGVLEINQADQKWDADLNNLHPRSDGFIAVVQIEGQDGGKTAVLNIGAFRKPDGSLFHDAAMDIVTLRGTTTTPDGQKVGYEEKIQMLGSKYVFVSINENQHAQTIVYDTVTKKGWMQDCRTDPKTGDIVSCEGAKPEPKAARLQNLWRVLQERICVPVFTAFADDLRYVSRGDGIRSILGRDVRGREGKIETIKSDYIKSGVALK